MYTKITRAKHGAAAISYVLKDKGHFQDRRNDMLGYVNLTPHMDVTKQMGHYWKYASSRHQVQIRRVIMSFTEKECDRNDEYRKAQVMEMAKSGLSQMYPDRQILLALQTDGRSGYVHIHALVNDVSMTEHKGIPSNENTFKYLKDNLTKHMEESGFILDYGQKRKESKKSQYQKYLEDNGKYSWRKDLRDRVLFAYKKSTDETSFRELLNALGVQYNDSDKRKYSSFTLNDLSYFEMNGLKLPKKKLTARGDKLDIRLTKGNLSEHFHDEKLTAHNMPPKDDLLEIKSMKSCKLPKATKQAEKAVVQKDVSLQKKPQISESRLEILNKISNEKTKIDKKNKKRSTIDYIKKDSGRVTDFNVSKIRSRTIQTNCDFEF